MGPRLSPLFRLHWGPELCHLLGPAANVNEGSRLQARKTSGCPPPPPGGEHPKPAGDGLWPPGNAEVMVTDVWPFQEKLEIS